MSEKSLIIKPGDILLREVSIQHRYYFALDKKKGANVLVCEDEHGNGERTIPVKEITKIYRLAYP